MTERNVLIGRFTVFAIGLAIMLTGAVIWLSIIDPLSLWTAALWFFAIPLVALIFLGVVGGVGFSSEPVMSPRVGGAALVLLAIMLVDMLLWQSLTPDSVLDAASVGISGVEGLLLVGILFAIYEETFFTAITGFFKRAGLPDIVTIILVMIVFTFLHALRYPDTLFYTLFLSLSRAMLTGALIKAKNSDVPYLAHVAFNILAVFF